MGYPGIGPRYIRLGRVLGFPPCLLERREATRMGTRGGKVGGAYGLRSG
jgi:hypothetical protein